MFEHQEPILLADALKAFEAILAAVPKNKRALVFQAAETLEISLRMHAQLLTIVHKFLTSSPGDEAGRDKLVAMIEQLCPALKLDPVETSEKRQE